MQLIEILPAIYFYEFSAACCCFEWITNLNLSP